MGPLTVDEEGDLPLAHADAGDDGLADVLAGVRLGDRLEVQLVAVAQDLGTVGDSRGRQGGDTGRPQSSAARPGPKSVPVGIPVPVSGVGCGKRRGRGATVGTFRGSV